MIKTYLVVAFALSIVISAVWYRVSFEIGCRKINGVVVSTGHSFTCLDKDSIRIIKLPQ